MKSVRLRQRKIGGGKSSLYLDIYLDGDRQVESLGLYLVAEHTRMDRERNEDTLQVAQSIRRKRERQLVDGDGYTELDTLFYDYIDKRAKAKWKAGLLPHLREYEENEDVTFGEITPEWVKGFKAYLDKASTLARAQVKKRKLIRPLGQMTKFTHFAHLCAVLNKAVDDGIIARSPAYGIPNFNKVESTRMYLTMAELETLVNTPCRNDVVRRAFLFSCLTGLRCSDIVKLDWADVHTTPTGTRIIFRQKKTHGVEYLDLNSQAVELMGKRSAGVVFKNFVNPSNSSLIIQRWAKAAGIDKHITFHSARHTFAVMMLELGVDIYTVSKLLGHRELATTQIYAKVLDKAKIEAVKKIPKFF